MTIEHPLTPIQAEHVGALVAQIAELKRTAGSFLDYCVKEAGLKPSPTGWQLSPDGKCLVGDVPDEK